MALNRSRALDRPNGVPSSHMSDFPSFSSSFSSSFYEEINLSLNHREVLELKKKKINIYKKKNRKKKSNIRNDCQMDPYFNCVTAVEKTAAVALSEGCVVKRRGR